VLREDQLGTAQADLRRARARLCAAIVDRLTFGGTILETGTDSYRLAQATKQRTT